MREIFYNKFNGVNSTQKVSRIQEIDGAHLYDFIVISLTKPRNLRKHSYSVSGIQTLSFHFVEIRPGVIANLSTVCDSY